MSQQNHTTQRVALFIATLASFLTPFMGSSTNIALPSIGKEFALDAVVLSWVATAYLLAAAIFLVPFGKLADIHGRKRIFAWGMALYTLSSLLCGLSPSAGLLILFRIVQGLGSAMIFGTGVAILTSVFPPGDRGRALGVNVASVYLGLSLGPLAGGLLTQHLGWRSIFLFNVPLGLILVALVLVKLRGEWAEARGESFDLVGSALYGLVMVFLMYGFSRLPASIGFWLVLIGLAGLILFLLWELRVATPVLDMRLFLANRVFAFSNLAALVNYSATFAVGFLLSLYLQYLKGLSAQDAGLVLVSQPIVMALFSPFAGRLSDRVESRVVSSWGMGLIVVGLLLLALVRQTTPLSFLIATLMLLGLGFALFSSPNTNAVMSSVEKRYYGVASATLGTMRLTGQMFSMGIAMLILALYVGKVQITPASHGPFLTSMKMAFLVFAVLCFGGVFASLARGKVRRD